MQRHHSAVVISAYRATSIVDTPMRKFEVLEEQDGTVWLRETSFEHRTAHVNMLHLEPHEAQTLARCLINLEEQTGTVEFSRRNPPVGTNGDVGRNGEVA